MTVEMLQLKQISQQERESLTSESFVCICNLELPPRIFTTSSIFTYLLMRVNKYVRYPL